MISTSLHRFARSVLLALFLAAACGPALAENKSDLWWNPLQSGRGLIVIDHETDMFLVWCTYGIGGMPTWFVVPGGTLSADRRTFHGRYYRTSTVGYGEIQATNVWDLGTATIDFAPDGAAPGWAKFTLADDGGNEFAESFDLTRQPFGTAAPAWGTDATDMWWDRENAGWGVAVIQHGSEIFAIVLSYGYSGEPTFFVAPAPRRTGLATFEAEVYATSVSSPFAASRVRVLEAGTAWMRFLSPPTPGSYATIMEFRTDAAWVPQPMLTRLSFGRSQP
jgi:hypothetical protein